MRSFIQKFYHSLEIVQKAQRMSKDKDAPVAQVLRLVTRPGLFLVSVLHSDRSCQCVLYETKDQQSTVVNDADAGGTFDAGSATLWNLRGGSRDEVCVFDVVA